MGWLYRVAAAQSVRAIPLGRCGFEHGPGAGSVSKKTAREVSEKAVSGAEAWCVRMDVLVFERFQERSWGGGLEVVVTNGMGCKMRRRDGLLKGQHQVEMRDWVGAGSCADVSYAVPVMGER